MANSTSKKTIQAEVKLKGVDKANQSIKDLTTAIKQMVKSINKISNSFSTTLNNINSNAKTLGKTLNGITNRTQKFKDSLSNVEKSAKKTASSMNKSSAKVAEGMKQVRTAVKQSVNGIKQGYEGIEQKSEEAADAAKKANEKIGGSLRRMAIRFRTYLDYRIINTVASSLKNLGQAAIDLEASFANIQAITSASDTEMDKLRNTILKVGEASKYSVTEISDATVMLGQAGLTADEINNVLETTTQLAAGTGSSLQNTIDLMTSALAVWGLNSEEATHLSDVMVTGMNRTKATLETFRMAVQYAGATMASLNISFDEFASVAAAAANAGIKASVVGTGLRAVTSELISPTTKMVKGLAQLGLTTEDVNIKNNGLVNVLQKLKDAGLNASNAYSLFGRRAAQFILAAQGQLDVVTDLQLAFTESGATLKAYDTQMNTTAAQWTALGNTIKEIAYDIVNSTDGIIHDTLSSLNSFIRWIRDDLSDTLHAEKNDIENAYRATKKYSDTLSNFMKKDYGDDSVKAIEDVNKLIESVNRTFGKTIDFIEPTENLADAYEKVAKALKDVRDEQNNLRNMKLWEERGAILQEGRKKLYKYGSIWYDNPKGITNMNSMFDNALLRYEKLLRENDVVGESTIRGEIQNLQKEGNTLGVKILSNAFETAKKLVNAGDFTSITPDEDKKAIEDGFNEIAKTINTNVQNILLKEKESTEGITIPIVKNTYKSIEEQIGRLNEIMGSEGGLNKEELITALKSLVEDENGNIRDSVNENYKIWIDTLVENIRSVDNTQLDSSTQKLIQDKIGDLQNSLKTNAISFVENLKSLFEAKGNGESVLEAQSLLDEYEKLDIIKKEIRDVKLQNKLDTASRKAQKDIDRERAREFNKKYQNLALQMQADSYSQDISEARRKGVSMGLSDIDKTGTLSSYYNLKSDDLSKIQSIKTAIANKKTLEEYKKDYGDVFEQVQKGTVDLQEADYKTDGLISKMLKLDKSVAEVEGRFGDLDEIDLSDLDNQIVELQKELDEIRKSGGNWFKEGVIGFKMGVESMKDTVSSAKLGEMIATDLGNGMSDALYSVADGTKSMKEAFSDLARSVLEDISKMLIKMAVLKTMEAGISFFGNGGEVNPDSEKQIMVGAEYATGGFIPKVRAAAGTVIRGGIQGKDSVPAMLMPGEYVLKKSAVDALGTNFLNDLNNNTAQTLMNTSANMFQRNASSNDKVEPAVTNVWIVSKPDEAQMGPNDIIATIGKDILTGGQTRKLIQQVVAGRK